jgi:bacteriocin biosynthesis cyclodehydratase domain-containing protein
MKAGEAVASPTGDLHKWAAALLQYADTVIPDNPRLVSWVREVEMDGGVLQLRSSEAFYHVRHPMLAATYRAAAPFLDGTRTVDTLKEELPDVEPTVLIFLLKMLRGMGLIVDGAAKGMAREQVSRITFFEQLTDDPVSVANRLSAGRIFVLGSRALSILVTKILKEAGCAAARSCFLAEGDWSAAAMQRELDGWRPELIVMCTEAPMTVTALMVNEFALRCNIPWLHVTISGTSALLGPLIIPGQTGCFTCFDSRLRANLKAADSTAAEVVSPLGDFRSGDFGGFAPFHHVVAGNAASEATRFIGGYAPPTMVGRCIEIDGALLTTKRHDVLRVPKCPACQSVRSSAC